jgi:uncharacterized protein YndB with AHSA1/START domain
MTDYAYPLSTASSLVERIESVPDGAASRRWVLRDDNQQHYHGRISLTDDPTYLELLWKPSVRGREQVVGVYRLHLAQRLAGGYVRREDDTSAESHAAAIKHTVITAEHAMGGIKRYLQLRTVIAAKQRAHAHAVTRIPANV